MSSAILKLFDDLLLSCDVILYSDKRQKNQCALTLFQKPSGNNTFIEKKLVENIFIF